MLELGAYQEERSSLVEVAGFPWEAEEKVASAKNIKDTILHFRSIGFGLGS